MMSKRLSPPAMKADTDALARQLDGHDQRFIGIDVRFDKVDKRFDTVDARFDKLERVQKNFAIELIHLRADMGVLENRIDDRMNRLEDRVVTALDRSVARMETLWGESALIPQALDRLNKTLDDHERRIRILEVRPM